MLSQALEVDKNQDTVRSYISSMMTEVNLSKSYEKSVNNVLRQLSRFTKKSYRDMTKDDIVPFLNSFRKSEPLDPLHKWIGTYNLYAIHLIRFFRWLHYPDMAPKDRPRPNCIMNISQLTRKEKSIYKPTDLWTADDDLLFLKYCPSKRDRCYHTVSRDSSCRPHEILSIRVKDVVFKMAGDRQYAEILVNGKTGTRHIPLINSIPYLKDWLDNHPHRTNPNSALFCGFGKSLGRAMGLRTLNHLYLAYRRNIFPKFLQNPTIAPEDMNKIRELLKKPWNPYIRRHSALTDKSKILKEHVLRQHAGWSGNSQMHLKYVHYFGNESSESILEAYGLKPKSEENDSMKPKQCPNCAEPNKPDAKFCAKCRMVLTYDTYNETLEEKQEKESEIKLLGQKYERDMKDMRDEMESKFNQILAKIDVKKLR